MRKIWPFMILSLFPWNCLFSQSSFTFDEGVEKDKIPFELINNLIIIPVELNGLKLSFLLDTGVNTTVLLGINEGDSLDLSQAEKVKLRGIGSDSYIEALKSGENKVRIGKTSNEDLTIFHILDQNINFSPRLGFPVHGIIGHDFFKDFLVEINYKRKFIRIYPFNDPPRRTRRYEAVPLVFFKNKPYINCWLHIGDKKIKTTLLLDSGLADAIWLFEKRGAISIPETSYKDFLGMGLLVDIQGSRSRINSLAIADFELENVIASFPDTTAFGGLKLFVTRDGSLGGEIMRRFHMIFNYRDRKLFLRKNNDFGDDYGTNMSGITVEHAGYVIIESYARPPSFTAEKGKEVFSTAAEILKSFSLKPEFRIVRLREGSPAEKAGLITGDFILSINGKKTYKMNIEEIAEIFASRDGKKLKLKVRRGVQELDYTFILENPL